MMDKVGDVAQKMLTALPVGEKLWNTGKAILDKIKPKWWPFYRLLHCGITPQCLKFKE